MILYIIGYLICFIFWMWLSFPFLNKKETSKALAFGFLSWIGVCIIIAWTIEYCNANKRK
jgi:hypothetical protein